MLFHHIQRFCLEFYILLTTTSSLQILYERTLLPVLKIIHATAGMTLDHENKLITLLTNVTPADEKKIVSEYQLGLYCTFAPRRSHPQPRHYAPTTGLDPSPLQDFALLIRSLLVSDAPGSRTFKPCLGSFWCTY